MTTEIPVLDHGYVRLVESLGSDRSVVEAARMSTGKGFLGWGPRCPDCGDTERGERTIDNGGNGIVICVACTSQMSRVPGDEKLLRFLYENRHATPFEMGTVVLEVQAPIFVFREWHRHRVPFSYNEASARYEPLPDVNYVPSVERLMLNAGGSNKQAGTVAGSAALTAESAEWFRSKLGFAYAEAEEVYQYALKIGVPKELARVHLPVGRYSKMRASSNLRGWLNFLALRSDVNPAAQWEIRQYGNAVAEILGGIFPRTLALFATLRRAP